MGDCPLASCENDIELWRPISLIMFGAREKRFFNGGFKRLRGCEEAKLFCLTSFFPFFLFSFQGNVS